MTDNPIRNLILSFIHHSSRFHERFRVSVTELPSGRKPFSSECRSCSEIFRLQMGPKIGETDGKSPTLFRHYGDRPNVQRRMRAHEWNNSRCPPCHSYGPCVWAVPQTLKGGRFRVINKRRWYRYPRWSWPSVSIQRSTFSMDLTQADDRRGAGFVFQIPVFHPLYNILFRPEGVNHPPVYPNPYSSSKVYS